MAKAKKSSSESADKSSKPAKTTKPAAKAPADKPAPPKVAKKSTKTEAKSAKKPAGKAAAPSLIDTNLAAQAAAAMVLNRGGASTPSAPAPAAPKESASFKAFKQGLNKPQGPGGLLGGGFQQKKGGAHQPFGGGKQVGHNQTFGADVTRTGVPRRTPG